MNGQLLIGASTAPYIRVGFLTGSGGITVTPGPGTINISLAGGSTVLETLTPNSGTSPVVPVGGTINVLGIGSLTTVGSLNTLTVELTGLTNNSILYGLGTTTIGLVAATNNAVLTTGTGGTPVLTALASNGQLIIGSGSGAPIAATLTAGNGITITNAANSITIASNGQAIAYTNVNHAASPYTVLVTDYYISVDCSGGAVTLNFPNAPVAKQLWIVKDRTGSAATNNITLTTPGASVTFDGSTTYLLSTNYSSIELLANATPTYELI